MNTPSETMGLAERQKQCEELIGPLRRAMQREERAAKKHIVSRWDKWFLQNGHRFSAVIFLLLGFSGLLQSWKVGLTMLVANQRVLLCEGTCYLAWGVFFVIAALQLWGQPAVISRHRLLFLLAEDFLERNKEPSPAPKPSPATGA